jgi:GT2 family glycosyltransferase
MIATHDRLDELKRTLDRVRALTPQPDELLITADACTDGTVEFLRREWPAARVFINQPGRGSIASRDAMMRAATSDFILSLDDDSYPIEPDALARLRELFGRFPRLAVVSLPQRTDEVPETLTQTEFGPAKFVGSYVNCACAFRRAAFLEVGGVFTPFWHAYDEPDFTLRCAAAGWQVRFDPCITIRHYFSPTNRNEIRVHHFHARNELWSVVLRCPAPQVFAVALFRIARQFGYACRRGFGWVMREPQWWWALARVLPRAWSQRAPVPWRVYFGWLRLLRQPVATVEEWNALFGSEPK